MLEFKYHKSLDTLHVNCEKPRAYFIPYDSEQKALAGERSASARFVSLCGEWDFRYFARPSDIEDFTADSFAMGADKMDVPRSWQTVLGRGYDVPQYTNHLYPFAFEPASRPLGKTLSALFKRRRA